MSVSVSQEVLDLLRRAVATAQDDQRTEATKMLQRVTREAPHLADAWSWLAYSTDDPLERVGSMQRVVSLDPENQDARNWLVRNGFPVQAPGATTGEDAEIDGMWVGEFERDRRRLLDRDQQAEAESEGQTVREESGDLDELDEVDFTPLPRSPSSPDFGELLRELDDDQHPSPSAIARDAPEISPDVARDETPAQSLALEVEARADEPFPDAESTGVGLGALREAGASPANPLDLLEAEDSSPRLEPEEVVEEARRPRVLLLHADAASRSLLRTAFGQLGCSVSVARDQNDALQVATQQGPDLIVTSGEFEGGTASELCRTLKALPETAGVVLVVHQTSGGMLAKLRARTSGVDEFLTGELTSDALSELYERRLGKASRSD